MQDEIRTYAELQGQMHDALREQHPDWVEPNGDCSTCDLYERRFAEQLALLPNKAADKTSDTLQAEMTTRPPRDPSS